MSHEIKHKDTPEQTDLWGYILKNDAGVMKVNINGGDTWEVWNISNIDTYDVAVTEIAQGIYTADFPASITTIGEYLFVVMKGAVDISAVPKEIYKISWSGTAELTALKIAANKSTYNKSTGVMTVYDDDGTTPILTLTMSGADSTVTRTPS